METNLYTAVIPPMTKTLQNLGNILDKISEVAKAKASDWQPAERFEEALLGDRLIFDQFPFVRQVQVACDNAKGGAARLAGIEPPKFEDTEKTIAELKARIEKTIAFVQTIKPEQVVGQEGRLVSLSYFPQKMTAFGYATEYLLPNFYFHVTTAYSILRKNGVPVGKADYIGAMPFVD
ncbi:MAG TPA: DUF1993 domain-containing protein [Candidatus Paceibacterota bacterium]|nr:DUF1993 domain-containing protein [Candidatus Paceibacterota bacterium]